MTDCSPKTNPEENNTDVRDDGIDIHQESRYAGKSENADAKSNPLLVRQPIGKNRNNKINRES